MFNGFPLISRTRIGWLVLLAALLAGGGLVVWERTTAPVPPLRSALPPLATDTPLTSFVPPPTTPVPPSAAENPFPPYRGEPVAVIQSDPIFLATIPKEFYEENLRELKELAGKIAGTNSPPAWMRVAAIKHFYNDDTGARDAYEYLNVVASGDPIPFYNLATIYAYNLKEPSKALPKYQAAIQRDPRNAVYYLGLAGFYREVTGDLVSAEATLLVATKKVPTEPGLYVALASVSQALGKIPEARENYGRALTFRSLSESERRAIERELAALAAEGAP